MAPERDPKVRKGHFRWLSQQRPVAISDGWILLRYPIKTEAHRAHSNEAIVRLGNKLRSEGIAEVLEIHLAPVNGSSTEPRLQAGADRANARREERRPWERDPVYMPTFVVATPLPHTDLETPEFARVNGNLETTLVSKRGVGLPFGVYASLIAIHLATNVVRTRSRKFHEGRSINELLRRMQIRDSGARKPLRR